MSEGWIVLHRKLIDWEWYTDLPAKTLFLHCLFKANYENKKWRGEIIKRGEFISSLGKLAKETGLSVKQIRNSLSKLKMTGDLQTKGTTYTKITICNYSIYQDKSNNRGTERAQEGHGVFNDFTKDNSKNQKNGHEKDTTWGTERMHVNTYNDNNYEDNSQHKGTIWGTTLAKEGHTEGTGGAQNRATTKQVNNINKENNNNINKLYEPQGDSTAGLFQDYNHKPLLDLQEPEIKPQDAPKIASDSSSSNINHLQSPSAQKGHSQSLDELFEKSWKIFPEQKVLNKNGGRKGAKKSALQAWNKIPSTEHQKIYQSLSGYQKYLRENTWLPSCSFAVYLNQGKWEQYLGDAISESNTDTLWKDLTEDGHIPISFPRGDFNRIVSGLLATDITEDQVFTAWDNYMYINQYNEYRKGFKSFMNRDNVLQYSRYPDETVEALRKENKKQKAI